MIPILFSLCEKKNWLNVDLCIIEYEKKGVIYSSVFIRNLRSQEEMSLKYRKKQKNSLENLSTHSQFLSKHIYI